MPRGKPLTKNPFKKNTKAWQIFALRKEFRKKIAREPIWHKKCALRRERDAGIKMIRALPNLKPGPKPRKKTGNKKKASASSSKHKASKGNY